MSSLAKKYTIYVSCDGSDENSGFSVKEPICSIEKLNKILAETPPAPGSAIYFRKGDCFVGELTIRNVSGKQDAYLYLGSYGEGDNHPIITAPPIINGVKSEDNYKQVFKVLEEMGETAETYQGNFERPADSQIMSAIKVIESDYLIIDGIDFASDNDGVTYYSNLTNSKAMVYIYGCSFIRLKNIKIKGSVVGRPKSYVADVANKINHVNGLHMIPYQGNDYFGLMIQCMKKIETESFDNLIIENIEASGVTSAVCLSNGCNNFTIRKCRVYDSPAWGMSLTDACNGRIYDCEISNTGYGINPDGNAAFMMTSSQNLILDGFKAYNIRRGTQGFDGVAFDFEGGKNQHHVTLRNAEFEGVDGPGIMIFWNTDGNQDFLIENVVMRDCNRNGTREGALNMCWGATTYPNTGIIRNVTIYQKSDLPFYTGYDDNTKPLLQYKGVVFENCEFIRT